MFITVIGEPQGKARPRFKRGRVYTPQKTKDYEKRVHLAALEAGLKPTLNPISITINAVHKRPKRLNKRTLECRTIKTTKPDLDNIVKVILDGLKSFFDDKQVYSIQANKYYCSPLEELPKVEIFIDELENKP